MGDDVYEYEYHGRDRHDMPVWSCGRVGSGIVGFGPTQKDALVDFLDKEQELVPLPRYELTDLGRSDQPPELRRVPYSDPDEAYNDYREDNA